MRILTKYVLREFLEPVAYCAIGFTMLYVVIDLFNEFDDILTARPPPGMLLRYLSGYVAELVQWLLPASLLLGGLYAMWQLARHSEIIAMRANGIGFGAITAPMLAAAAVLALLSAANSEFYAPAAGRLAARIAKNKFRPLARDIHLDVPYNNHARQRVWRIGRIEMGDRAGFARVRVTQERADGAPEMVLTAPRAAYLDGAWWFFQPYFTFYDSQGNPRLDQPAALAARSLVCMPQYNETPRDFMLEVMQGEHDRQNLSLRDMVRYVKARPRLPRSIKVARRYDIHHRLAAPWACVVITLFAVPAGVASGRQSVFKGVLLAVSLFLAFYAVTQLCMVLAHKELVPVGLAAWLPNATFLVAGALLFHRQR